VHCAGMCRSRSTPASQQFITTASQKTAAAARTAGSKRKSVSQHVRAVRARKKIVQLLKLAPSPAMQQPPSSGPELLREQQAIL